MKEGPNQDLINRGCDLVHVVLTIFCDNLFACFCRQKNFASNTCHHFFVKIANLCCTLLNIDFSKCNVDLVVSFMGFSVSLIIP